MKKPCVIWVLMMLWESACTSEESDSSVVIKQFKLGQNEQLQFTNQDATVVTQGYYVKIPIKIPDGVQYDVEDMRRSRLTLIDTFRSIYNTWLDFRGALQLFFILFEIINSFF